MTAIIIDVGENTAEAIRAARAAQLALDTVQAAGAYYTSQAAGEAATTAGQFFCYDSSGHLYYAKRTVGGSTVIAEAASKAMIEASPGNSAVVQLIAGLTPSADQGIMFSGAGAAALFTLTAFARSLLDDANGVAALTTLGLSDNAKAFVTAANYAAMRIALGVQIGSHVQAHDAELDLLAALTSTAFGRSLLELTDAEDLRAAAGITAAGDPPVFGLRAWGKFSVSGGSVTTNGSGNIASITRSGTGLYNVAFTTPMPDENYAVLANCTRNNSATQWDNAMPYNQTAAGFSIMAQDINGVNKDQARVWFGVTC